MPIMSILNQAHGGLPLKATFTSPADGPVCFVLCGSVWSATANQMIGVMLELDGKIIGSASIYSNGTSEHRAVVPSYIAVNLAYGPHTVTLVPLSPVTVTDLNDLFDVALLY
jgi:hypothetical protein